MRLKLLCIFGIGCGVFGENVWLVSDRVIKSFLLLLFVLFEDDGVVTIIELIICVDGVCSWFGFCVSIVGENSSSSCFLAERKGSYVPLNRDEILLQRNLFKMCQLTSHSSSMRSSSCGLSQNHLNCALIHCNSLLNIYLDFDRVLFYKKYDFIKKNRVRVNI